MPFTATVYKVFIASPGDVPKERDMARDVIHEWNAVWAESERAILQPIRWESDSFPDMADRAQGIINRQILEKSDILVAIFWYRLGTATGVAESGTIEEIENHLRAGRPAMIYFSSKDVPHNVDIEQLQATRRAKKSYRERGLIDTFANPDEFRQKFTRHLSARMVEYLKSQPTQGRFETTSTAALMSALSRLSPSAATDAVRLLQLAAKSDDREIHRGKVMGGFEIIVNWRHFIGDQKNEARWISAVNELERCGFVKTAGDSGIYQVTGVGDMFLKDLSKEALAKFAAADEVFVNAELKLEVKEPGSFTSDRFDYIVRVPRAAAEDYRIEWNMRYLSKDREFKNLVFSVLPLEGGHGN